MTRFPGKGRSGSFQRLKETLKKTTIGRRNECGNEHSGAIYHHQMTMSSKKCDNVVIKRQLCGSFIAEGDFERIRIAILPCCQPLSASIVARWVFCNSPGIRPQAVAQDVAVTP